MQLYDYMIIMNNILYDFFHKLQNIHIHINPA